MMFPDFTAKLTTPELLIFVIVTIVTALCVLLFMDWYMAARKEKKPTSQILEYLLKQQQRVEYVESQIKHLQVLQAKMIALMAESNISTDPPPLHYEISEAKRIYKNMLEHHQAQIEQYGAIS